MIVAGIDSGSRTIKVVLFDTGKCRAIAAGVSDQGVEQGRLAMGLFERVLRKAGVKKRDVRGIVATGYGRNTVAFADTTISEITCHARGARHEMGRVGTVIDIGGQDSKIVKLDASGDVRDFAVNDRCAAGTGRFLEMVAARFKVDLTGFGGLAGRARRPAPINSTCAVFAETEIAGLLASGEKQAAIAAGVQSAIASRIAAMAGRDLAGPIVFTGGVAMVPGMARALRRALNHRIVPAKNSQLTGALGAALIAAERCQAVD